MPSNSKSLQLCLPYADPLPSPLSTGELVAIYLETARSLMNGPAIPEIEVRYYPFVGINSTIRSRRNKLYVRLSDILQDAPVEIHRALASILLRKILRRRVPPAATAIFREYCERPSVSESHASSRKRRGRKLISGAAGHVWDLEEQFRTVNRRYFREALPLPRLSWSQKPTRRIFGHHDPVHNTIIVSKSLDDPEVPVFVVQYILFHEMLHLILTPRTENGRTVYHSFEFRREEKRFAQFAEANEWLKRLASRRRRVAKKSKLAGRALRKRR